MRIIPLTIAAALLWVYGSFSLPARAQDGAPAATTAPGAEEIDFTEADYGEAAPILREIAPLKKKTVILIFDVSGSMNGAQKIPRSREAAVNILREGVAPGDRVALFTFGQVSSKVFDETVESNADKSDLVDKIPSKTAEGHGTNIRRPHHEALKLVASRQPDPAAIIILTDSFNDEPRQNDAAYADYKRYYTPGGQLTKYPNTTENRDYESLLAKLKTAGTLKQYGIGINFDATGRPIERLPKNAPDPAEESSAPAATVPRAPVEKPSSPLPLILLGLGGLAAAGVIGYLVSSQKPMPLRITGAAPRPKDFSVKSGQSIRLGGDGAGVAFDAYPLPGTKDAVATLKTSRGGFSLTPAPNSNGTAIPRVYLNGIVIERETPLRYGDEVRVSLPDPSGAGIAKEYRLKFDDPRNI